MRLACSLVCRAWRDSIDLSRHLVVVGHKNIARVADALEEGGGLHCKRSGVKEIYIRVEERGGPTKAEAVGRVLKQVSEVEHVELVTTYAGMNDGTLGWVSIVPAIDEALTRLGQIKHFKFGTDPTLAVASVPRLDTAAVVR